MPVKIRLTRMGKKKQPSYRVVVMDSRKPRDGAYIEQIGFYDPRQEPSQIQIDNEAALKWLRNGAQPTERARKLLEISGAWIDFRISRGDVLEAAVASESAVPAAEAVAGHKPEIHVVGGDEAPEARDLAAEAPEAATPEPAAEVVAEAAADAVETEEV